MSIDIIDNIFTKYVSQFGYNTVDFEKDPIKSIRDWVMKEYQMTLEKLSSSTSRGELIDLIHLYFSQFGYKKEDFNRDPLKKIKERIVTEQNQIRSRLNSLTNSNRSIKREDLDNWYLVEAAKRAFDNHQWSEAKKSFLKSIELCKRNNWIDGIKYAEEMISKCNQNLQ